MYCNNNNNNNNNNNKLDLYSAFQNTQGRFTKKGVLVEEVWKVLGGQGVEGFVGEEEEFVGDAVFHMEPV